MGFFFYGSLKRGCDGWQEMGLKQVDFTEIVDPMAMAPGRMYSQVSPGSGRAYPAFVFNPLEPDLVTGELHRLLDMDKSKREHLLACLNEWEDYRADDLFSRYRLQEILLRKPKLVATCWTWQQPVESLERIYTWPPS